MNESENYQERNDNIRELINTAGYFSKENTNDSLSAFLESVSLVGDTDNLKWTLKHGLLDVGKTLKVEEVNTDIGTDHLLSAHSKGIESKQIYQAGDKGEAYKPALDDINEILSDEEVNSNLQRLYFKRKKGWF